MRRAMDVDLIAQCKKSDAAYSAAHSLFHPVQIFERFWSPEELEFLLEMKALAYANPQCLRERQGRGRDQASDLMAWPVGSVHERLEAFFQEKLRRYLRCEVKFGFAFHHNYHPYGLHTDAGYDQNEVIYRQGIVPLQLEPLGAKSYTVIMKQRCYFSSSFPPKSQYRAQDQQIIDEVKAQWIEGYRPVDHICAEQRARYWGQNAAYHEALRGFEIDQAFAWKVGDMAVWDRSQIHCSSDFMHHGLRSKLGLMWVTTVV